MNQFQFGLDLLNDGFRYVQPVVFIRRSGVQGFDRTYLADHR